MQPIAPVAPTTNNTNQPFGGAGQAASDYAAATNILSALPGQEATATTNANNINNDPNSILPTINIAPANYTSPVVQTVNPTAYGTNLTAYNTATQNATQNLLSSENSTYGAAQGALNTAEEQYGNLTPIYQAAASAFNVPGYMSDITQLQSLLGSLNSDVNAETSVGGGAVTAAEKQEQYEQQYQPLENQLNIAGENLNYGEQNVGNLIDTYEKSLSNELTPLESNISNLPTLFGQTNTAAEGQYQAGQSTIEDTISNAINQQSANAQTQSANIAAQQLRDEYGNGAAATAGSLATDPSALNAGVSFKNGKNGANGYDFTVNGKPASMAEWTVANAATLYGSNTNEAQGIISTLTGLAGGGDTYSANALAAIMASPNQQITPAIIKQFPAIFGGFDVPATTANTTTKSSATAPSTSSNGLLTDQSPILGINNPLAL